jgi:hypothetical protein
LKNFAALERVAGSAVLQQKKCLGVTNAAFAIPWIWIRNHGKGASQICITS